uniref:Uncharacterized protein n=1 Tax=Loa loa TaxID=7209 RepID=A0A1I7VLY4_LOALO
MEDINCLRNLIGRLQFHGRELQQYDNPRNNPRSVELQISEEVQPNTDQDHVIDGQRQWESLISDQKPKAFTSIRLKLPKYNRSSCVYGRIKLSVFQQRFEMCITPVKNYPGLSPGLIQNRVEEIRKVKFMFRYIPSEHNLADGTTKIIRNNRLDSQIHRINNQQQIITVTITFNREKSTLSERHKLTEWLLIRQVQSEELTGEEIYKWNLYYNEDEKLWRSRRRLEELSENGKHSTHLLRHNPVTKLFILN